MRILVVGGGGREHALAWKLAQEAEVLCAPGNPGIADDVECVPVGQFEGAELVKLCHKRDIDLAVVGPEDPLVAGVGDTLRASGIAVYGPNADGARLEASKAFSKELMLAAGVPTAISGTFDDPEAAREYARRRFGEGRKLVVKASGNAVGKGVIMAGSVEEALDAIQQLMVAREFGAAGEVVVIEDELPGPEFSVLTIIGDQNFVSLPAAQDHKRAFDGNTGPNTGGMGTISPLAWVDSDMMAKVEASVVAPIIEALRARDIPFRGTLFSGLMMDGDVIRCLEYNVRFGDPEIQSLVLRLGTGFADALLQAASGDKIVAPQVLANASTTVVIANSGYPTAPRKGAEISIGALPPGVKLFHAGTSMKDGRLIASGGRVFGVSASAATPAEAKKLAYEGVAAVKFDGGFCRTDIGGPQS